MPLEIHEILSRLIGFRTISLQPNLALLDYVESLLVPAGITVRRFVHADGDRASLWATVGPEIDGGIVLSGHSDVVPVAGQEWRSDPFILRQDEGRWYGRGAVDMKGFVAVALHTMLKAAERDLQRPLHLALSYDEEVGCLGVRDMIETLAQEPLRPAFCLIGEPTGMRIATGHKGKMSFRACCHGQEGHSALAPEALNALHLGAAFLQSGIWHGGRPLRPRPRYPGPDLRARRDGAGTQARRVCRDFSDRKLRVLPQAHSRCLRKGISALTLRLWRTISTISGEKYLSYFPARAKGR